MEFPSVLAEVRPIFTVLKEYILTEAGLQYIYFFYNQHLKYIISRFQVLKYKG